VASPASVGLAFPAAAPTAASPLAGLTVTIEGTGLSAVVDENGVFQIDGVPSGTIRLHFTGDGIDVVIEIENVADTQFIELQVQITPTDAILLSDEREDKVELCHAEGNGTYHDITISQSAESSHRAHGDGAVGDPVPGQTDMTFDEDCVPEGPSVSIEKSTNNEDADSAPGPEIPVGSDVVWNYEVTNDGTVELTNVQVTDNQGVDVECETTTLAVGESMTCTGTGTAELGQYANLGMVSADWATDDDSGEISDSDASHYFGFVPEEEDEEDGPKVTLCHRTGAGFYVAINVSVDAEPAHRAHGDASPGEAVPGFPGLFFSEGCVAE